MKTKKIITLLLVLATVFCFAGCKNASDDGDSDPKGDSNSIYGKWEAILDIEWLSQFDETAAAAFTEEEAEAYVGYAFLIGFSETQSITISMEFKENSVTLVMTGEEPIIKDATYEQNGNVWTVTAKGEPGEPDEPAVFTVNGNKLTGTEFPLVEFTKK